MAMEIEQHFIVKYEAAVHLAYQQRGSKLRKAVRLVTGVNSAQYKFPKSGRGQAGKKARNGNVPIMGAGSSSVTVTLEDWYAADYVDTLDQAKTNVDELGVIANIGAFAVGRKMDDLIISKAATASKVIPVGATGLTRAKVLEAFAYLNNKDVPDDGQRFAAVGANQWNELLAIEEFKNSDYAGDAFPWLKGAETRVWLGTVWMFHSGLPLASGTRTCFMWHKDSLGLAEGVGIKTHIDWVPEKAAHLVDNIMSAGAALIDSDGVVAIECDDDAAIPA
jgi:hypothetical protein